MLQAGYCEEARASFDLSEAAPQVVDPPPEAVAQALKVYRGRMYESCPGFLLLECRPRSLRVSIDGGPLETCSPNPIPVARGNHVVIATIGDESIQREVYVDAFDSVMVSLVIEGAEEDISVSGTDAVVAAPSLWSTYGIVGWVSAGTGGAVLLTALGVDLFVLDSSLRDLREASASGDAARYDSVRPSVTSQQTLVQGLVISGGALVGAGIAMVLLDILGDGPAGEEGSLRLEVSAMPSRASVLLRW
jgi:hypothetical protein